jgi:cytohesin
VVELLMQSGARVNTVDVFGASAAIVAAREGRLDVLVALIKAGADINGPHVISDFSDALMRASRRGHVACAEALLAAGADPDTRDKQGRTPLMYSVQDNKMDVLKTLLKYKARIDLRAADGVTAESWALQYNRLEMTPLFTKT